MKWNSSRCGRVLAFAALVVAVVAGSARAADTAPETTISDYDIAYDHATIWFTGDATAVSFRCSLDGAAFVECVSPAQYTSLAPGTHEFQVAAVDASGVVDPTPANISWTATTPPAPPPTPPANDGFYGAETIAGVEGSVSGSNVNATQEWNEPYSPVRGGVSVWYTWTAERNGPVTFSAASNDFGPTVSVFLGDAPDHVVLLGSGVGSASFDATQGSTYRVMVDGENGGTGAFTLSWAYAATGAPANDYFADAQELSGAEGSVSGTNEGATVELGEPVHSGTSCCVNDNGHSIWYRWTAPFTGTAFFTTQGSSFDTDLRAYSGTSVDSLSSHGAYTGDLNPWTTWSRLELRVQAGETYMIAVDGAGGATGSVQLNWRTAEKTDDLTAPTVNLWAPEPNAHVSGTVAFLADAADESGVDRVAFWIGPADGSGTQWLIGEVTAGGPTYELDFDTSVLPDGVYSVDAVAWDASGNGAASGFSIQVGSLPPPTLTVPRNMTVEAVDASGAVVKYKASARDYQGVTLAVRCTPPSGATFRLGTTKVVCTTSDAYGNSVTKSFTITVADTTAPTLTVPADFAVNAVAPAGASVTYSATALDAVSGSLAPACTPASGATFAIGDTTVACAATDGAGNRASASFVVHVKGVVEQLEDARAYVASLALADSFGSKLDAQLADVEKQFAGKRLQAVCGGLADFRDTVVRESGKRLTAEQSGRLAADATRIRAVAGC
jgi:hypothetical protein